MAVSYVQGIGKGQVTAGVSSQTVTFDAALTSGNFVIMLTQGNSKSVTYSPSNNGTALTWNTLGPFDHSAQNIRMYAFWAQVTAGDVTTVTVTRSSGTATIPLGAYEFAGVLSSGSVSLGSDTAETTGTSHDVSTGLSPSAGALLIGFITSSSSASFTQASRT